MDRSFSRNSDHGLHPGRCKKYCDNTFLCFICLKHRYPSAQQHPMVQCLAPTVVAVGYSEAARKWMRRAEKRKEKSASQAARTGAPEFTLYEKNPVTGAL